MQATSESTGVASQFTIVGTAEKGCFLEITARLHAASNGLPDWHGQSLALGRSEYIIVRVGRVPGDPRWVEAGRVLLTVRPAEA